MDVDVDVNTDMARYICAHLPHVFLSAMYVVLSLCFVSLMFDYPYIMLHAAGVAWTGVTDTDLVPAFDWYCALDAMFTNVVWWCTIVYV